ncbi:MAG: class I adenylate-forming enzyme family protein [Microthrixaceae bacterium]
MNLLLLLEMAASGGGDRTAVQIGDQRLTAAELLAAAWGGAGQLEASSALVYVGTNSLAFPIGLFACAAAGVPFVPLNYRLDDDRLAAMIDTLAETSSAGDQPGPLVVADTERVAFFTERGHRVVATADFVDASLAGSTEGEVPVDSEHTAVLLHTSGTTSAPKAAVLRHRHLTSYVIGSVEFGAADQDEAALVSVPPYHVAGLANLLSNLYLGRRIVYLPQFDADEWVGTVRSEGVTNAMVVPTMLARIADVLDRQGETLPSLRAMSYGGARTSSQVLSRVMDLLPEVGLTNAYGLTETSSTIAVLGPEDHRAARDGDPEAARRLSSAGRLLPSIEVEIRGDDGPVPAGSPGEIWVRGEQVSGEYRGIGSGVDDEGWFPTKDRGWVDDDGYLFIEGRSDDTIIRGGENIAPAEIEEVLLDHPRVAECAVVGVPDDEWGQRIAAVIVAEPGDVPDVESLREFVRGRLRGSKTPDQVTFAESLPYTDTGKLLRRNLVSELSERD